MKRLVISAGAQARLAQAATWLAEQPRATPVWVVGTTLDAASEVARSAASTASFGWRRVTLGRLAAIAASGELLSRGLTALSPFGVEALCARIVHHLARSGALRKFEPVATQPGLPRALARTLQEARLAEQRPSEDLGRLLEAYERELQAAGLADRAEVIRLAIAAAPPAVFSTSALLVDVPVQSALEQRLVSLFAGDVLATCPSADLKSQTGLANALSAAPEFLDEPRGTSLQRVQQDLFGEGAKAGSGDDVVILSAPGESRECAEIARRVLREAERGVPFDEMAVLLRSPPQYRALLEEAFGRAGIPAHFASGSLRPDPSGRAFLALLACAQEGLSARRFAEYLSLGEVPDAEDGAPPPALPSGDRWVPPDVELTARAGLAETPSDFLPRQIADPDAPVAGGVLRAPWRWEQLLVDAAVIGGRERWARRLDGLAAQLQAQLEDLADDEARSRRLQRELDDLASLRAYALPLLEALASLPKQGTWGEWIEPLTALATRALRQPSRVLSTLAELWPMAPVGPVGLGEVRLVLSRRLTELPVAAGSHRHGKVYVAKAEAARGLAFDVVFVPGLAEKIFPQKVIEDPLLRDRERGKLEGLATSQDRIDDERLALRIAVGAARDRVVLSWPRIDLQQGRARVPSFYALEVLRAAEGVLPSYARLSRRAELTASARAGWPAPEDPADAIDEAEHDLALLRRAFQAPASESRGIAAYLLTSNPHLGRALRARARRWLRRWTPADGLVHPAPEALAALQAHHPSSRSYSPTALQNFAACPYRFVLQAVHRLAPRQVPESIDEIDPLSRGSLIHEAQYELLRELAEAGALPIVDLAEAQRRLEVTVDRVALRWEDKLAPAISRVWSDCIAGVKIDLREWLRRKAEDKTWTPWRFELSFGLPETAKRDPHSATDPVVLQEGLRLRGSIDLVERSADGTLRATDHKSGRAWAQPGTVIGGGATLQPALYALALEQLFAGAHVEGGRLDYCTYTGGFEEVLVPLDGTARGSIRALAQTLADDIARGFLPAAPRNDRECERCDYLDVCGPLEWQRTRRKPPQDLVALNALREMP